MIKKFENFDHFSKKYREIHDKNLRLSGANSDYFCEYKILEVKKHEKTKKELKILDVGCGDGSSEEFFSKHFSKSKITGIDVSKVSIKVAKDKKIPRCSFLNYDGEKIPFKDNTFDVIFVACVFHHINKNFHQKIADEIMRVLKPKGRLYIFEHNPLNPLTQYMVNDCIFDKNAELIRSSELVKLFKIMKKEIFYTIFFPRSNFFKFLVPLEKYLIKMPFGGQYFVKLVK